MKILLITQEYPPCVGGAGVVAKQTVEGLAAAGHDITVVTRHWPITEQANGNVKFVQAGGVRRLWPVFMAKSLRALNMDSYDNIIVNDIGAALVFGTFFAKTSLLQKTIMYLHGGEPQTIFKQPRGFIRLSNFTPRYLKLLQGCKHIIAVSHFMKSYFLQQCPIALAESKIKVVYAGVDEKLFRPVPSSLRTDLAIASSTAVLLSVGRITRSKGFAKMLELFAELINLDSNFHWVIVGDGNFAAELQQSVISKELQQHISFIGAVARDQLPAYYSGSDLFWLLSDSESFGLVYIEAQLCGCPAMGSDNSGIPEAIANGASGYLAGEGAACLDWIEQRQFANLASKAITQHASQFALSRQLDTLQQLL